MGAMADEDPPASRRAELIAAGLTLLLGIGLAVIAADVIRSRRGAPKTPCGCQDKGDGDGA